MTQPTQPGKRDASEAARLASARAKEGARAYKAAPVAQPAQPPELPRFTIDDLSQALKDGDSGLARLAVRVLEGRFLRIVNGTDEKGGVTYRFDHACGFWRKDANQSGKTLVRDTLRAEMRQEEVRLKAALAEAASKDEQAKIEGRMKKVRRAIDRLNSHEGLQKTFALACMGPESIAVEEERFDRDPWALHCLNGRVCLRSGEFRPGRPEDMATRYCRAEWTGLDQEAPRFVAFLESSFADREDSKRLELLAYLQKALGAALVGEYQRTFHILFGKHGSDGKTTLAEIIGDILGEYAYPLPSAVLMQSASGAGMGPAPEITELKARRFTWASETQKGGKLNVERLKWLTGGDTVNARGLFASPERFAPSHSLYLLSNHLPHIGADEEAFWKRVRLVRFNLSFVERPGKGYERLWNPNLKNEVLEHERSGVLAWLVRGCLEWQRYHLEPPAEVLSAADEYRLREDAVAAFVRARCHEAQESKEKAQTLYEAFKDWHAEEYGEEAKTLGSKKFWDALEGHFEREKGKNTYFKGVRLS